MIKRRPRKTNPPTHGADLHNQPSLSCGIGFPENGQDGLGDIHGTPEVGFQLCSRLGVRDGFGVASQAIAGVVDHDIKPAELVDGCFDDMDDLTRVGHVQCELQHGRLVVR